MLGRKVQSKTSFMMVLICLPFMMFLVTMSQAQSTPVPTSGSTGTSCSIWTDWMSDENGTAVDPAGSGEFEVFSLLRQSFEFCEDPTQIECALANDTSVAYNQTGQKELVCSLSSGFLCFHDKQGGAKCQDYAIRVACPSTCPSTTTISLDPVSTNSDGITTVITTNPVTTPTNPQAQSTPAPTSGSTGTSCSIWTDWMSDENGTAVDPAGAGEFEVFSILSQSFEFCDDPTQIECALANDTSVAYNQTGQKELVCSLSSGFVCFHDKQEGAKCQDYAIRVACPSTCPSTTTISLDPVSTNSDGITTVITTNPVTTPTNPQAQSTPVPTSGSTGTSCSIWTDWMSDENGTAVDPAGSGEFEVFSLLRQSFEFCEDPTQIECALANDISVAFNQTGQKELVCSLSSGFLCFHDKQGGAKCQDYAIRVACPSTCPSTTTISLDPVSTSSDGITTVITTNPVTTPTNPQAQSTPAPTSGSTGTSCSIWTDWMSDENGTAVDPAGAGEFEVFSILSQSFEFCDDPTQIECALANDTSVAYNQTGQKELVYIATTAITTDPVSTQPDIATTSITTDPVSTQPDSATTDTFASPVSTQPDIPTPTGETSTISNPTTRSTTKNTCAIKTCPLEYSMNFKVLVKKDTKDFCDLAKDVYFGTDIEVCCCNITKQSQLPDKSKRDILDDEDDDNKSYEVEIMLLIRDSETVSQETVLKTFLNRLPVIGSYSKYGIQVIPESVSVEEISLQSKSSDENRLTQIITVVFGTIAGVLLIIAVAYCSWFALYCRLRRIHFQKTVVHRKHLVDKTDTKPQSEDLFYGTSTDKSDEVFYRTPRGHVDRGNKLRMNHRSNAEPKASSVRRWSYLFGKHEYDSVDVLMLQEANQPVPVTNSHVIQPKYANGIMEELEPYREELSTEQTVMDQHYQEFPVPDAHIPKYYQQQIAYPM
ncbi:mucin-5AC-like [Glandiceps talaboti]